MDTCLRFLHLSLWQTLALAGATESALYGCIHRTESKITHSDCMHGMWLVLMFQKLSLDFISY